MNNFLQSLSLWPIMALFLIVFPLATIGAQALIRSRFPEIRAQRHNDVAGFLVAVIGVIYAVTAGFMIANQWENYTEARERTWHEAYALAAVAESSVVMPPDVQAAVREGVVDYNQAVIDWWPRQDRLGASDDPREEQTLQRLFELMNRIEPTTDAQRSFIDHANESLMEVAMDRNQRLHEANRAHLEAPLWIIISIAGAVTVLFCLLFGLETQWLHYTMVAALAITIGISFLLVLLLNYPLSGVMPIKPESYESVVRDLTS